MGTKLSYKPGSFYRVDDRSGFVVRAEHTRKQWNNLIVRLESFEERQPQDFVRGRRDNQTVPQPRPRSANVFLGVQTNVSMPVPSLGPFSSGFSDGFDTGGTFKILPVQSAMGFNVGDSISVQLNNGATFFTTAQSIDFTANVITPSTALPFPVSVGNTVTDLTSFTNV